MVDHTLEVHFEVKPNMTMGNPVVDVRSMLIQRMANAFLKGNLGANTDADVHATCIAEQCYDMTMALLEGLSEFKGK